jgi:hypothetical protein
MAFRKGMEDRLSGRATTNERAWSREQLMNFRANQPNLARLRKVWYCLCLGFTPALATRVGGQFEAETRRGSAPFEQREHSQPYLGVVGAPPLRFQEPAHTDFSEAPPPGGAPPTPGSPLDSSAAKPAGSLPSPAATAPAQTAAMTQPVPASATHSPGQPVGPDSTPPTILPDEMRPWVRPEEFLPFFQLPGSGVPATPSPEQPPKLPPSSATYKEQ